MTPRISACWRSVGVLLLAASLGAGSASAETYVGGAGGAAISWSGDVGWSVLGEIGTDWSSKYFRIGGEFAYSNYDQNVDYRLAGFGEIPIELRTYEVRLIMRYVLFPGKLTPYIGFGGELALIDLDDTMVKARIVNPLLLRGDNKLGFGGGVLGLVGLEMPLFTKRVNLFAEARVQYTWEITSNLDPVVDPTNFSGLHGLAGLRVRF
jgi:hypothetical protein